MSAAAEIKARQQGLANQVRLAARLYEVRDSVRFLLGARYQAHMKKLGAQINLVRVAAVRASELEIALEFAKMDGLADVERLCWIAAAVELIEPSEGVA